MTYLEIIALINQWIITNGNREITAAVLNPVLRAMTEFVRSVTGDLANLNTSNNDNLVSAINEVNTALANVNINGSQVYYGEPNPNTTPPPFFKPGDFYLQEDIFNDPVALFVYDGFVWKNINQTIGLNEPIRYLELRLIGKGVGNTDPLMKFILQAGDSVQGRKDATTVWTEAIYNGGDPTDRNNYTPVVQTLLE